MPLKALYFSCQPIYECDMIEQFSQGDGDGLKACRNNLNIYIQLLLATLFWAVFFCAALFLKKGD
jgi:hypothetical protein